MSAYIKNIWNKRPKILFFTSHAYKVVIFSLKSLFTFYNVYNTFENSVSLFNLYEMLYVLQPNSNTHCQ